MKNYLTLLLVLCTINSISAQYTSIPDTNFEAYLETIITDDNSGDGQVPTSEIQSLTSLDVQSLNISDLTGIEDFRALETLYFGNNNVTEIDVSNLTSLKSVRGFNNELTALDLTNNLALTDIRMQENQLTYIDLSNQANLRILQINGNELETIVESNSTALVRFRAYDNHLKSVDLSQNTALTQIQVQNNELHTLNVQNGNNMNVFKFIANNNDDLECILVDDVDHSIENWDSIDDAVSFSSTYCSYTTIPDANFEAALNGYDDISNDGQVPTELIEVITSLDVSDNSITDLTGIQDFEALETLNVANNNLTSLDVSNNTNLTELTTSENSNLTSLDVSGCMLLERITSEANAFTTIDLLENTALDALKISDNATFSSINLVNNTLLRVLTLKSLDKLEIVDVSKNASIDSLQVTNNFKLSQFNVKNGTNTDIIQFVASGNDSLTCIQVDNVSYSNTFWTAIDDTASFSETQYCNYTAIPDANFEAELEAQGYDDISGDGQVPTLLIEGLTELDVSSREIADLTGIEDFVALVDLDVEVNDLTSIDLSNQPLLETVDLDSNNLTSVILPTNGSLKTFICNNNENLTSLDFSGNINLETIQCGRNALEDVDLKNLTVLKNLSLNTNNITSLDISASTQLETLTLGENALSSLDVSNNISLIYISVGENQLTSIDITANTALQYFLFSDNAISTIDVSQNTALLWLYVQNGELTTIDVSQNTLLQKLWVNGNDLTTIDVSNNTVLTEFACYENNISSLDVAVNTALSWFYVNDNNLTSVNLKNGNNTNISSFSAHNNENLTCILVDDASYSTTNWSLVDNHTIFSDTDCLYTSIPDANFEAELDAQGYDDISGDGQILTENIIGITELDIRNEGITDLTGIENFRALKELRANQNQITTIDLSQNTALELLYLGDNDITSLDLSANINLSELSIDDLDLSAGIDLSANVNLTVLSAEESSLSTLDLSKNVLLTDVDLTENNLTTLDITALTVLENLTVDDNQLSSIDLLNNTALAFFSFDSNNFSSLDFSNLSNLAIINGSANNSLTAITLNGVTGLERFTVNTSALISLDLSDAVNITSLSLLGNDLESLDLSSNTSLTQVQIPNNNLTSVDLRNIDLSQFTFFTAFGNDNLTCITVSDVASAKEHLSDDFEYSIDCGTYTYVPDANFELALAVYDDIPRDDHIPTVAIEILTSLDVSNLGIISLEGIQGFVALKSLNASENSIEQLDLSKNIALEEIDLEENDLKILDLSSLINLTSLGVAFNDLFSLNIKNGANTSLTHFDALGNDLTCVLVDSESYALENLSVGIDEGASFNETDCTIYVTIPDDQFENELAAYDDVFNDNQVPLDRIYFITSMDIDSEGISDLTGIEAFVSLQELDCSDNNLTTLDVSKNTMLHSLSCDNNQLTSLNVSECTLLTTLDVEDNLLSSIDISTNVLLENLDLEDNNLTELDITGLTKLMDLDVEGSELTAIDLSQNTLIEDLDLDDNQFGSIDLTNNTALTRADLDDNSLLTEVTFGNASNLATVYVDKTALETIDVTMLTGLETLDVGDNNLETLDISQNTVLDDLRADNNALVSLNLKNGNNSNFTRMEIDGNSALYCVQVDDVDYANTNFIEKDDQTTFSADCETLSMSLEVILEGAFDSGEGGILMQDDLRDNNVLPTTSPYEDALTCEVSVFDTHGSNAVVDWVEVQLRNANDVSEVVARTSGLLLRSGEIVDVDGESSLSLTAWQGNYYIAVAHRNHLTIASSSVQLLTDAILDLDMTATSNILNGADAMTDMGNGFYAMPAGDVDGNGQIQNNDLSTANAELGSSSYSNSDVDMNGQIQNSDINSIINVNLGRGEQVYINE